MRLRLLSALAFTSLTQVVAQPTIRLGAATVVGKQMPGSQVDFFGGIPYAKPPLGELRLNLPVLTTSLQGERFDGTDFGPGCIQLPSPPSGVSEDCLTLSIFRPSGISPSTRLPVVVWLYGGGFMVGDSSYYNPTGLVTRSVQRNTPVIYASINYRLGPLGFPTGLEAKQAGVLNLGLYDQRTALQWIQQNIANFGGDKSKVTIMGESAGAISVQIHFLTTKILGLARAGVMESTAFVSLFKPEVTQANYNAWVGAIPGCASSIAQNKTLECIREVDTSAVYQAQVAKGITYSGPLQFGPVIDGPQGLIADRWSRNPPQTHLPLLLGCNLDEGTFLAPQDINSTQRIHDVVLGRLSPPSLSPAQMNEGFDTLFELYPDVPSLGSPFGTGNNTFGLNSQYKRGAAILGDYVFTSGRRIIAQNRSMIGDKTFAYLFTDHEATVVPEFATANPAPGSMGVTHTAEIPYVFGSLTNVSSKALALATVMQDYWLSFVTSLDPNDGHGSKRPHWQEYTPKNKDVIQLDGSGISMIPDTFREAPIDFFINNPDFFNN